MREPCAWMGWIVVAGVCSWPQWEPAPMPLLLGAGHLCLLAWVGHRWRSSWAALAVAAFLLGAAAPGLLPPPAAGEHLRGEVVQASGRRAILQAHPGQAELWFPEDAPRPGTQVAVWVAPASAWVRLPGALDTAPGLRRAHRDRFRVRSWVPIGAPTEPDADAQRGAVWFAQAAHGALLWSLASGDRSHIPEPTVQLMRRTGTAHLLAISGMHIGLVSGVVWLIAWWLSRPLVMLSWPWPARAVPAAMSLIAAWSYAGLVGWPVSARRAAAMVSALALARLLGRQARTWSLLGLSAAGIVLTDPAQVGEIGFWMSFGAVAGILWWSHAATRWLPPDHPRWAGWVGGSIGASIGATIGTLPVTAWLFQQLSPLTVITNLTAGPLLAGVAVPAALVSRQLPDGPARLALAGADAAAEVAMSILTVLDVTPLTPAVEPLGVLLLALVLPLRKKPVAAAALVLLALGLRERPTTLQVTFLSVGQGDAALIEWPDGVRWLVDGGPPSDRLLHYLRRRGIRHIDAVILSHPHPDHMGGLQPVVEHLEVGQLWVPRPPEHSEESYLALWQAAFAHDVPLYTPADADRMARGTLLHPVDGWTAQTRRRRVNEESLVVRIEHGAHSFLFTGDIEEEAEDALLERLEPVTVVKVAHHGSTTSSGEAFVEATQAAWAVISCGAGNRFRHPRPLTLHRWRHAQVLRTDQGGSIQFRTDGNTLVVRQGL